jgi:hypothetical protein
MAFAFYRDHQARPAGFSAQKEYLYVSNPPLWTRFCGGVLCMRMIFCNRICASMLKAFKFRYERKLGRSWRGKMGYTCLVSRVFGTSSLELRMYMGSSFHEKPSPTRLSCEGGSPCIQLFCFWETCKRISCRISRCAQTTRQFVHGVCVLYKIAFLNAPTGASV